MECKLKLGLLLTLLLISQVQVENITSSYVTNLLDNQTSIQLPEFSRLAHGLSSGPIVIINEKTFLVPNLHYDGLGPDAHFWVGNGSEPDEKGILVPDEKGSRDSLRSYRGESVYITLPDNLTIHQIEYFGLWCIKFTQNFGHVNIPKDLSMAPMTQDYHITEDGRIILRIPKCCPIGQVLLSGSCDYHPEMLFDPTFPIHSNNDTHLNDIPLELSKTKFDPFIYNMTTCKQRYAIENKEFILLTNGSILLYDPKSVKSQGEFCIETINLNYGDPNLADDIQTTALLCAPQESTNSASLKYLYRTCFLISIILFVFSIGVYISIRELHDEPIEKCFIAYAVSMLGLTICLLIGTMVYNTHLYRTGYAYHAFLFSSLLWGSCMNWEIRYMVKFYKKNYSTKEKNRRRLMKYILISIIGTVALYLIIVISQVDIRMPNYVSHEDEGRISKGAIPIYILYGFVILSNIILGVFVKWRLYQNGQELSKDVIWTTQQSKLIQLHRSLGVLLLVIVICFLVDIVSFSLVDKGIVIALNIIHAIQGLIVALIFVAREAIFKKIKALTRCNSGYQNPETNMTVMNGNVDKNNSETDIEMNKTTDKLMQ